jgi:hypothetical protein
MHEYIRDYVEDHHIPVVSQFYNRPIPFNANGMQDILRGEVVQVGATGTMLRLFNGMTVIVYASTTLEKAIPVPEIGDDVIVFGTVSNGMFELVDIRPAPHSSFGAPMHTHERKDFDYKELWGMQPIMK